MIDVTFEDFAKVELKVGTVVEAEEVEGSEKLLKLKIDLGPVIPAKAGIQLTKNKKWIPHQVRDDKKEKDNKAEITSQASPDRNDGRDIRQILAGIKQYYKPEQLVGKQVVVVANLEPRMMMGLESQGMLLAADNGRPVLLKPLTKVSPGAKVK